MYYIIKKPNQENYSLLHIENTTDGTYHEVKEQVDDLVGQFGREDYAQIWCDYYNGVITMVEVKSKLRLF